MMGERILLIGSGGREHALAWKLSQSSLVSQIFVAPGNAGTGKGDNKVSNVVLDMKDFASIAKWCCDNTISFVVVGPEDPLALGIVDFITKNANIPVFGPSAGAAQIEADKSFSKHFMIRHNIPTAKFETFTDPDAACKYITEADHKALVVKASGLAAGKGVTVAATVDEACSAVNTMMREKAFGSAGDVVVVEELLQGPEVSVLAFSDGHDVFLMPPAQDHKRLLDNDGGPNTGGMGAVCPYPGLSEADLNKVKIDVIKRTVDGLAKEGHTYIGVLYAGLMLTSEGPKVLEFNCRFGDPETQSILSLLTSDLMPTLKACVSGNLLQALPTFDTERSAVGVVVVSGGYPGVYEKGLTISGVSNVDGLPNVKVFHAGTKMSEDGDVVSSGGRVLAVVATDRSLSSAMMKATEGAVGISFKGSFFRRDIGAKLCQRIAPENKSGLSYRDSGVDIWAGDRLVQAIKPFARSTRRPGCDADLGGFGGLFDLKAACHDRSDLACCTQGVGRKLAYADCNEGHYKIGLDLVAQCSNALLTCRAEPLFFLDYFATGRLEVKVAQEVIRGIADGCVKAGCALIGGETAEMPGMYKAEDYDVAGMVVGASSSLTPPLPPAAGDMIIGLSWAGLQHDDFDVLDEVLAAGNMSVTDMRGLFEELVLPTPSYTKDILPLLQSGQMKLFTPVTGGLKGHLSDLTDIGLRVKVDAQRWSIAPLFGWMATMCQIEPSKLFEICSCGVSALLVVEAKNVSAMVKHLKGTLATMNVDAGVIGQIILGGGDADHVQIEHAHQGLDASKNRAFEVAPSSFDCLLHSSSLPQPIGANVNKRTKQHSATFNLNSLDLSEPVLVAGTDGVGTKLKVAQSQNCHNTIGIDLVAMCVNDLLAAGAEPAVFTSYLGASSTGLPILTEVMDGVTAGCSIAGCSLVETKSSGIPFLYSGHTYDLAGFSVGAVNKQDILPRKIDMLPGDVLIGLPSSGLHSNGFSLVRRVIEVNGLRFDMPSPFFSPNVAFETTKRLSLGVELLAPTEIYVKSVLPTLRSGKVKGLAHITGGGLVENIPRVIPPELDVELDASKWPMHPVFGWLQHMGDISSCEMSRTFNCGLGLVLIVGENDVTHVSDMLNHAAARPTIVGSLVPRKDGKERVHISHLCEALAASWPRPPVPTRRKRVAVLISGSGTNLQALIDHTQNKNSNSSAEITLVISNVPNVAGLVRAERAGIKTQVIRHKGFKSRAEFDSAVHQCLIEHEIELVCLAGFMRILTGEFTNKWTGRMLNVHPSLLPSFKGANAHKLVLEAAVRISGCSVHFVAEEVDAGAILCQESVPVYPHDTEELLAERVKKVEHEAYPKALEMVASGRVVLVDGNILKWNW